MEVVLKAVNEYIVYYKKNIESLADLGVYQIIKEGALILQQAHSQVGYHLYQR